MYKIISSAAMLTGVVSDLEDVEDGVEEGEELLADGGVADEDGEEPERDVEVLLDAVEAERLGLRDLVEDVLHQVADDPQRVLDHGHRLRLQQENEDECFRPLWYWSDHQMQCLPACSCC